MKKLVDVGVEMRGTEDESEDREMCIELWCLRPQQRGAAGAGYRGNACTKEPPG